MVAPDDVTGIAHALRKLLDVGQTAILAGGRSGDDAAARRNRDRRRRRSGGAAALIHRAALLRQHHRTTLVDLRNVYDRGEAERAGLAYFGIGRGAT